MSISFTPEGLQVYEPDGPVLTEAFWDRSEFSVIQGPIGSGTSSMCCHKIFVISCEQEPDREGVRKSRWLIVRESYPQLEKTTIKTWLDWFAEEVFGDFRRSVPPTHMVRVPHPSGDGTTVEIELIFIAIDSPEVAENIAASFEITGFWVNEAQFVEKAVIDELLSRCGRYPPPKDGAGATWFGGFADMNAPVEGHWIPYMRGDIPLPDEWTDDMKAEMTPPEGWRFFMQPPGLIEVMEDGRPTYHPNPAAENQKHLVKPYMQQIRGKKKSWIDRRVLNKTGLYAEGKAVYESFSEMEHISEVDLYPTPGATVFVGLDFGRDPAAVMGQCFQGEWRVMEELIGDNVSAEIFAPKLKRFLAEKFPGHEMIFGGDPRGRDGTQATETTAYDIFATHGMRVEQATTDNDPELRRSTVDKVLDRRNGLQISPRCLVLKTGMAGGYHYPKIKGTTGLYAPRPKKNRYSHPVEAMENMMLIGGEGDNIVLGSRTRPAPAKMPKRRVRLRKFA
jgi:hypothetical protein